MLASTTWFCCFSEPGAETQLKTRCCLLDVISREEKPGEKGVGEGERGPCFPSFVPCQALRDFRPGDHLYLPINRSATVFSCLSQFPYSTCQGIFLAAYYSVSTLLQCLIDISNLCSNQNPHFFPPNLLFLTFLYPRPISHTIFGIISYSSLSYLISLLSSNSVGSTFKVYPEFTCNL